MLRPCSPGQDATFLTILYLARLQQPTKLKAVREQKRVAALLSGTALPLPRAVSQSSRAGGRPAITTIAGLPLAIYLLRNYMRNLPQEIMESARVDGATHFQIFVRIVLPLSVPALASFAIFQFLWVWNDLLVLLVFLSSQEAVMTNQIVSLLGSRGNDWHLLTAGAFISIALPLFVFLALQRYFVRGLLAGSVKGG